MNDFDINGLGCRKIEFPSMLDNRGALSFGEIGQHVPFTIKRFFMLYDLPLNSQRGKHAHRTCQQFIICASGSFNLKLSDLENEKTLNLSTRTYGIYVPARIWVELDSFASDTSILVFASEVYDENDYIYDKRVLRS